MGFKDLEVEILDMQWREEEAVRVSQLMLPSEEESFDSNLMTHRNDFLFANKFEVANAQETTR